MAITETNITQPFILVDKKTGKERYIGTDVDCISWNETLYEKRSAAPTKKQHLFNKILGKE